MPWLYAQRGYFHNLCFVSTSSWLDESNAFESSHVPWVDLVWSVRSFISFRFTELLSVTAGLQERHRLHYPSIWNLKAYSSLPTSTLDFVRVTRISNLAGNAVVSVIQIPCGWGVCISGEIFLCTEGSRTGCHQVSPHSMPRHTFRLTCDNFAVYTHYFFLVYFDVVMKQSKNRQVVAGTLFLGSCVEIHVLRFVCQYDLNITETRSYA